MARKHAVAAVALASLLVPAAAAAGTGGIAPPTPATDSGEVINEIYWVVFAVCAVALVLVEGALLYFIFRFRRRPETPEDVEGPQIHGNTRLEILWTTIPALGLVALAVFTFVRTPAVLAEPSRGQGTQRVLVEAHQFYWQYEYLDENGEEVGAITFDTLYLPVGRTAQLDLTSQDVAHSWWVPELTGKRDAIPGRVNRLSFTPERTGTFVHGKCGEFCGIQHAVMSTKVEVMEQEEFDAWLEERAQPLEQQAAIEFGEAEWFAACAKCHGDDGAGDIGPSIVGNGTLQSFEGLRNLLYEGQNQPTIPSYMPPVGRGWSEGQIRALLAYIESNEQLLGGEAQEGGDDGGSG